VQIYKVFELKQQLKFSMRPIFSSKKMKREPENRCMITGFKTHLHSIL
jgi:hypothetical protein